MQFFSKEDSLDFSLIEVAPNKYNLVIKFASANDEAAKHTVEINNVLPSDMIDLIEELTELQYSLRKMNKDYYAKEKSSSGV